MRDRFRRTGASWACPVFIVSRGPLAQTGSVRNRPRPTGAFQVRPPSRRTIPAYFSRYSRVGRVMPRCRAARATLPPHASSAVWHTVRSMSASEPVRAGSGITKACPGPFAGHRSRLQRDTATRWHGGCQRSPTDWHNVCLSWINRRANSQARLRQRWQISASARQQSCPAKHKLRAWPNDWLDAPACRGPR